VAVAAPRATRRRCSNVNLNTLRNVGSRISSADLASDVQVHHGLDLTWVPRRVHVVSGLHDDARGVLCDASQVLIGEVAHAVGGRI